LQNSLTERTILHQDRPTAGHAADSGIVGTFPIPLTIYRMGQK